MYHNEPYYFDKNPIEMTPDEAKFSFVHWKAKYEELERINQELRNLFNLLIDRNSESNKLFKDIGYDPLEPSRMSRKHDSDYYESPQDRGFGKFNT